MKKKIVIVILTTVLFLAACGAENSSGDISASHGNNHKELENSSDPEDGITEKGLEDIENYLLSRKLLSGDRVQMAADMVGAVSGFKYTDTVGEIYEYDMESEEYKKLSAGEEIPLKGMEGFKMKAVSVNGKFVLFGDNASQDLINGFDSFE